MHEFFPALPDVFDVAAAAAAGAIAAEAIVPLRALYSDFRFS